MYTTLKSINIKRSSSSCCIMTLSYQGGSYQAAPDSRARQAGSAARQADARHPVLGEAERAEEVEGDGRGAGQLRQPGHRGRQVRASRRPGDLDDYSLLFRIQKLWRGYTTRKYALRKREEELIFIGMVTSCHVCHV